jgi:SAM-dependent methyltransferase
MEDPMATTTDPARRTGAVQGDLWSERAADWTELMEPRMRPLYEAGLAGLAIEPGTNVLDVGCGSGLFLSLAAATGARVAGLDAAEGMLAVARRRLPDARLEHGDVEDLPFADASFDAVSGFNSFQYAASPSDALAEARRVLRPGGRLLAATWAPPEMCDLAPYLAALGALLPPPPPGAPGPFALSGDGALAALLASSGFAPQETRDVICHFDYRDADETLRALLSSGPGVRATRHSGLEPVQRAVLQSIAPFRQADGSYRIPNAFRFTRAIR